MKKFWFKNLIFPVLALAMLFLGKNALATTTIGDYTLSDETTYSPYQGGSVSQLINVASGISNPSLLCAIYTYDNNSISNVKYNNVSMNLIFSEYDCTHTTTNFYWLKNPTIGNYNLTFTKRATNENIYINCRTVSNIKQIGTILSQGNYCAGTNSSPYVHTYTDGDFQNDSLLVPFASFQNATTHSGNVFFSNLTWYRTKKFLYQTDLNNNNRVSWTFSGTNYYAYSKIVELRHDTGMEITTPTQNQAYSDLLDTTITVSGRCKTNGTNQLTLQSTYVLPQQQPTCDCVNGNFSCDYTFGSYGNASVCVIDKNDTTAYDCKSYTLTKANLQTSYGNNPYFTAMPWSCDILGCRFPLASNASWAFEYSYDQDITPYSQYNAPFIVRPLNVPLNSTTTKLYVAEITNPYGICNNCTSSYQVIQTLSNTTLNNLTATSSGFMYGGFDISTSTRYFLVSLKSATSSTIYQKQYISLSYSAAERPSGQPDFVWFQNTKDKLKGKLIFAQVFAFSDALNAFLNSTATQGSPLTFTMKSMSANNQFNLDIPIFDFSNSVVVNFAQRMRFLFIAGIWISFGFYLWNIFTKRLFRDDG